jgi:hypothetical protein
MEFISSKVSTSIAGGVLQWWLRQPWVVSQLAVIPRRVVGGG